MDKRKSILNISVSVTFKILTLFVGILTTRYLIRFCGNEVNGLNSLYANIVGLLAVAELGVGSAITFGMYRPIVEHDRDKVAALYHLFRRLYLVIGAVILISGLVITPFIHYFASDYEQLNVDLYTTFVLMLISVVVTYLFGAETALINAYKNNYITTAISSSGLLLQNVLQIVALVTTQSFVCFLLCRIAAALAQWIVTSLIANRKHADVISRHAAIDKQTRGELIRNIKAMFMHKIGSVLVGGVDSVVISSFIGVAVLGIYSNYMLILNAMSNVLRLVFTSLTSIWGHLFVEKTKDTARKYCEAFHLMNFIIGMVFFLGYYAVVDSLVAVAFAPELVTDGVTVFVIAYNGFVQFMRQNVVTFRDATGTFYHDRWKPLIEGALNLILSILMVKWIGVAGVIVATIITSVLICHIVEPYVLYKNAFQKNPKGYYLQNYGMLLVGFLAMLALNGMLKVHDNVWYSLWMNGWRSIAVSLSVSAIWLALNWKKYGDIFSMVLRNGNAD